MNTPSFQGLQLLCRIPLVATYKCGETAPLFSASEEPLYPPLRQWAKSTKKHPTDQNPLCELRYNRHVFCAGKIPPASESTAVWQMRTPPLVPEAFPYKPLLQRIQREKTLIRAQRKSRALLNDLICGYESDWQTQAEREDLLRSTKKARQSPHGLPPRSIVKGEDGNVPLNIVPTLKTASLPKPSENLLSEWNTTLYEATKDEKTPLKEEIDFYQQPISEHGSVERSNDGRERSLDDEKVNECQFDGINYGGVRDTTKGVPNREKWLEPRRSLFNPLGKKWSEVTADDKLDVTTDPDFPQNAREYDIEFSNLRVNEAAEQLGLNPNTLSQRISREQLTSIYHDVDFSKTFGKYFCIVTLKGVNYLHILGNVDAPLMDVLRAFFAEWKKSESNAIKQARKSIKAEGVLPRTARNWEREAAERIQDAYDAVIELVVPDAEGFGFTHYRFTHEELLEAARQSRSRFPNTKRRTRRFRNNKLKARWSALSHFSI